MQKHKSFTLIEMLIVVVIIGILAAALIPRIQSVQGRARDTQRKVDIGTLTNGMQIYYIDNQKYESAVATFGQYGGWEISIEPNWLSWLQGKYLTSVPRDPLNKHGAPGRDQRSNRPIAYAWYNYPRNPVGAACPTAKGDIGILGALIFENPKEPDNIKCRSSGWATVRVFDYSIGVISSGETLISQ